ILLTTLALNILSEGMTDAMAAPRTRASVKTDEQEANTAESAEALAADEIGTEATQAETTAAAVAGQDGASAGQNGAARESAAAEDHAGVLGQGGSQEELQRRLAELRESELARTDRLVYAGDAGPLLEVKNLSIAFPAAHGDVNIVDDVSFTVRPGETMGLVGESGCGKSITSMAIMGLLPSTARIQGQVLFDGQDVLAMNPKQRNTLRGHQMSMIYQDALSSLNPSMLIRAQLKQLTRRGGKRSAEELLELVGLDPVRTLKSYPHELSGGQRQRVLIAM